MKGESRINMRSKRRQSRVGADERILNGRRVLVGVTGGIAAYKAVELTRLLLRSGASVTVVMTEAATKFVAPLTFESITGRDVHVHMFSEDGSPSSWHTELSARADLIVVAPATADHMARLACGLADDLLSATLLASVKPRVLCPAMNPRMWANPATQDNVATLKRRGYRIVPPEEGEMARPGEEEGVGRLADPQTIHDEVARILTAPQDLKGVRVLVTAGRTEESWDPVRVLTNRASGRMGFALAEEARERGADVVLVHGPTDMVPPPGVDRVRITTAAEMANAVMSELPRARIVLMSAAVSDYTFAKTSERKIKKGDPSPKVKLTPTTDILKSISKIKGDRIVVGFALETENVLENALSKLREKHLDIVVANNPLEEGSGFAGETNQVLIIHRGGRVMDLPLQSKREVAREILNAVIELYRNPEPEPEPEVDLDVDLDEEIHGRVELAGLDMLEDAEAEAPEPLADNGQVARRVKTRRGGRRSRRARERETEPGAAVEEKHEETPVEKPKATKRRATRKAPSKKTSSKKSTAKSQPKKATKKTATKKASKKRATKKGAAKKTGAPDEAA